MGGGRAEREIRPRAGGNVSVELGVRGVEARGDDTTFLLVNAEAGKL